jgi:hypothetical protein
MTLRKDKSTANAAPRYLADPRQAAILLLRRIEKRDEGRENPTTRAQFTVPMLRRLWKRPRLTSDFVDEVAAWLAVAGWCFFNAESTYAAVRISAVKNWPRLGTKQMEDELNQVAAGQFPFDEYERLLGGDTTENSVAGETNHGEGAAGKAFDQEE